MPSSRGRGRSGEGPPRLIRAPRSLFWRLGIPWIALASSVAGCGGARRPPRTLSQPERPFPSIGTVEEGTASWYGPGYDGRQTSCGDRFDQDALTAAHPTWPCGTWVRVLFPITGRSVVVRINDLFPGHKGRIIDLSHGAARAIGLLGPGTGQVRLEVIRPPE